MKLLNTSLIILATISMIACGDDKTAKTTITTPTLDVNDPDYIPPILTAPPVDGQLTDNGTSFNQGTIGSMEYQIVGSSANVPPLAQMQVGQSFGFSVQAEQQNATAQYAVLCQIFAQSSTGELQELVSSQCQSSNSSYVFAIDQNAYSQIGTNNLNTPLVGAIRVVVQDANNQIQDIATPVKWNLQVLGSAVNQNPIINQQGNGNAQFQNNGQNLGNAQFQNNGQNLGNAQFQNNGQFQNSNQNFNRGNNRQRGNRNRQNRGNQRNFGANQGSQLTGTDALSALLQAFTR